ncbi:MAG: iron-containing alcohol dehydrogenase [Pseudomonadota bacterium]
MTASSFSFLCRSKIAFGINALDHLPFDLSSMGAHKPFVVQDAQSARADCTRPLIRAFKESEMTLGICPAMSQDREPDMDMLKDFYQTFINKGFDSIIALGAGPVADLAKALNMAVSFGPDTLIKGIDRTLAIKPLMPFAYLPTHVGTGMETSGIARFNGQRFDLPCLAPDLVLIDKTILSRQTLGDLIPAALTSLSVCCESFVLSKNPPARAYAATGIGLFMDNLFPLIGQGSASEASSISNCKTDQHHLAGLVHASVMTGVLLTNCKPAISFHLGREIAKTCQALPGHAMAIILPWVLQIFEGNTPNLGQLLLPLSGQDEFSAVPVLQQPDAAIQKLRSILNTLYRFSAGVTPRTLTELGMTKPMLALLQETLGSADQAIASDIPGVDPDKIKAVLAHSLDGQPITQD